MTKLNPQHNLHRETPTTIRSCAICFEAGPAGLELWLTRNERYFLPYTSAYEKAAARLSRMTR